MRVPFPTLEETTRASERRPSDAPFEPLTPAPHSENTPTRTHSSMRVPFPEYTPPEAQASPHDLEAAHAEAEAIRLKAVQDAERIREQAQREGYQRGYEQGYQHGTLEARQHADAELQQTVESLRAQLQQAIEEIRAQHAAYLQHAESQMLELALEVVRKVVREELKLQPAHVLAIVRDTLRRVQRFERLRLRVNPIDLETVRQHRPTLLQIVDGIEGIEIVEDRRVDPGGCIIETEQGVYDARIRTQLSEIERALREAA
ncbi:MAG: FliH/SctL family protein [Fimbriimonadales bacterium]